MKRKVYSLILLINILTLCFIGYINEVEALDVNQFTPEPQKTDRIIAKYIDEKTGEEVCESIQLDTEMAIVDLEALEASLLSPGYEYIQPDYKRQAYGGTPISWGTKRIGADKLSKKLESADGFVTVAVVDTGIDYNHEFLSSRYVGGYDFVDNDNDPMDENEHGTHVAGIITDATPDSVGIMAIRVLDATGTGYDSNIAKGIRYAVDNGANVINMSLGGVGFSPYMDEAIDYALSKDVMVVVAAGNDSNDVRYYYPAQKEEVIVVAATTRRDERAYFSNYGSTVDISAPGDDIYSSTPGNNYSNLSGISMATPYVSAVVAMIKLDELNRESDEIEELLLSNIEDLGTSGWDELFGQGLVNVGDFNDGTESFEVISPSNNTAQTDSITVKYDSNNHKGDDLKIYLDNDLMLNEKIDKDGVGEKIIDISNISQGDYTLTIELESYKNNIPITIIDDSEYVLWEDGCTVSAKKEWTIKLNAELDESTLLDNIFILNTNTNKFASIQPELSDNRKDIIVKHEKSFESHTAYSLYINKGIKSNDGKELKKGIKMIFEIE
ncbi:S8 family peptidase [Wukongibacter baidiensis]|uniref:S8 family peptidase n=1 Tax=Wukongibacter baidiensis TaxID=1723361 RepID=UPI003D7FBE1C